MQETYPSTISFQYEKLTMVVSKIQETFPPYTPTPGDSLDLIMYKAGQSSVVEYIEQLLEDS